METISNLTIDLTIQDNVDALLKSYFNSELENGGAKYSQVSMQSPLTQKQVRICLCQRLNMA